jgi:hypothetical protein
MSGDFFHNFNIAMDSQIFISSDHVSHGPFQFGTKAETLYMLARKKGVAQYCPQKFFTVGSWQSNREDVWQQISQAFSADSESIIVRSSAQGEDAEGHSMAGAYRSIPNVRVERGELFKAIEEVIASYGRVDPADQFLVQPMVTDVAIAGVMFTGDIQSGGPYVSINYDDWSGRTDAVTSGQHGKLLLVRQGCESQLEDKGLRRLIEVARELQSHTGEQHLDIEFCIRKTGEVLVLQVRKLGTVSKLNFVKYSRFEAAIEAVKRRIESGLGAETGLFGGVSVYSDMADWNPAEMIGTVPSPLALSLYQSLVTDSIWADARARMGYHKVSGALMANLAGRPYIDVRRSLNSLLPSGIDPQFATKLVDHQIACLKAEPSKHDKIEFEIAITCFDFCVDKRLQELTEAGFNRKEVAAFRQRLLEFTRDLIQGGAKSVASVLAETEQLAEARQAILRVENPKARAFRLLASVQSHGTMPFAVLARHGFIAASLLRSLVAREAVSEVEASQFMRSLDTVTSRLLSDLASYGAGALSPDQLLDEYGFLRPGTYDITSPRYDEAPQRITSTTSVDVSLASFRLSSQAVLKVEALLREAKIEMSAAELFDYMAAAISGREEAKFRFTRNLSDALMNFAQWGRRFGLTREAIANLTLQQIRDSVDVRKVQEDIHEAHFQQQTSRMIRLPNLISAPRDADIIEVPVATPNFITSGKVFAPTYELASDLDGDLQGKIVLIENADPGYDWIFGKNLAGLVTMFGGANSHMAIRCAEFGLPAAIGCGSRIYNDLRKAAVVELDCAAQIVRAAAV